MSYSGNLEDLGDAIESIIDSAVRSQNFQNLNQAISDCVNAAVDTGSEAVRRAVGAATRKEAASRKVVDARESDPLFVPGSQAKQTGPVKGDEQATDLPDFCQIDIGTRNQASGNFVYEIGKAVRSNDGTNGSRDGQN